MPSPTALRYRTAAPGTLVILRTAREGKRRGLSGADIQTIYGAALVADVAAWNAYVAGLVRDFYAETADPFLIKFHAIHTVARKAAETLLDRFNTPNSERTRELLIACAGYDPWNDWQWPAKGLNGLLVRERLNQILKVRHSFAHGFSMPSYPWTQSSTGQVRLTLASLRWNHAFFKNLVNVTDMGMKNHLMTNYGAATTW
jgi:hypothetical protein